MSYLAQYSACDPCTTRNGLNFNVKYLATINVVTYLDHPKGYPWKFPDTFFKIPEIGDNIEASGNITMKVCGRTFMQDGSIEIEVTKEFKI